MAVDGQARGQLADLQVGMAAEVGLGLETLIALAGYRLSQHLRIEWVGELKAVLRQVEVDILGY